MYLHYHHMKTTILSVLLAATMTVSAQKAFILDGTIANAPSPYGVLYTSDGNDTVSIGSDGTFRIEKVVTQPQHAAFIVPKMQMYLGVWLQNGHATHLTADGNNAKDARLTGSAEAIDSFLNSQPGSIARWQSAATDFNAFSNDWQQQADKLKAQADEVAAKVQATTGISSQPFRDYEAQQLRESGISKKCGFFYTLLKAGRAANADADYNAFMQQLDVNDYANTRNNNTFYYLQWRAACSGAMPNDYHAMLKALAEDVSAQDVRDEYGMRLLRMYFSMPDHSQADSVYALVSGMVSAPVADKAKSFYLASIRPTGSILPDFNVYDAKGAKRSFHSVCSRKVTVIDVWSTWCVPCCREIPFVAQLVERYKDNPDIQFVSISIDKNLANWKKYIASHNMSWQQYNIPDSEQRQFMDICAINGIPRFMVFGEGGKVVNMNAPAPSAQAMTDAIEALLK